MPTDGEPCGGCGTARPAGGEPVDTIRQRRINAIFGLAQFFIDHPEVPLPSSVVADCWCANDAEVEQLQAALGTDRPYGEYHSINVTIDMAYEPEYWTVRASMLSKRNKPRSV